LPLLDQQHRLYGTGGRNCDCAVSLGAGDTQEVGRDSDGLAPAAGVVVTGVEAGAELSSGTSFSPAADRAANPAPAYPFVRLFAAIA
jgi:hypothetical protein